ncbi:MAG: hypothetical protein JWN40_2258, partial [Phycisphaerales bacterium]|nr:hypothetical protein [Phycisphaerales bacterium]
HFPADRRREMDAACLVYNSKFAAYYLLHTSSRFAAYNQEVNVNELKSVPLPEGEVTLAGVKSQDDVDDRLRQAFGLKPAESVLVEDAFAYTMDAFRATKRLRKKSAQPVSPESAQSPGADAVMLEQYGDWFARVLRAGFGFEKRIRMTVYRTPVQEHSPALLVALHLDWPGDDDGVHFVDVKTSTLLQQILDLAHSVEQRSGDGATMRRRVFQTYDTIVHGHAKGSRMWHDRALRTEVRSAWHADARVGQGRLAAAGDPTDAVRLPVRLQRRVPGDRRGDGPDHAERERRDDERVPGAASPPSCRPTRTRRWCWIAPAGTPRRRCACRRT